MTMKTVCLCNSNLAWGGGEKWHLEAALALAERGWRVLILCHPEGALYSRVPRDQPNLSTLPIALGRLSFLNPLLIARLKGIFRKEKVDALIMNLPADLKAAGPAARAAGVKQIIFRRGSALPVRDSRLNRRLYGKILTRLIVNSEATLKMVFANNPAIISPDKVVVLPNGIDVADFDRKLAAADPLPLPELSPGPGPYTGKPLIIGNSGRLSRQKGQELLLVLAAMLKRRGCSFYLVVAGAGERMEELERLSERLQVRDRVWFTGFLEDTFPFWAAIDVFVLTSYWEGFGYVLLEAMLAEKPILAFRTSNIPELVRDGSNGLLFPLPERDGKPLSVDDLYLQTMLAPMADAIISLADDEPARRRMGSNGRDFAANGFSQQKCMDRLECILAGVP